LISFSCFFKNPFLSLLASLKLYSGSVSSSIAVITGSYFCLAAQPFLFGDFEGIFFFFFLANIIGDAFGFLDISSSSSESSS
jgi:hypothetical protein